MDRIDITRGPPRVSDETQQSERDARAQYMPGAFLKEAGTVIAVCLVLALLAQVLVTIVGKP